MKRTILIMEDSPLKAWRVKEASENYGFEVIVTVALETAKKFLGKNTVTAIVTDNSTILDEECREPVLEPRAGHLLMEWLEQEGKKIPVLGNSMTPFKTTYPYYQGQMMGYFDRDTFNKFINSLEDQIE